MLISAPEGQQIIGTGIIGIGISARIVGTGI